MFKKKGIILKSKKISWGKLRLWVPTPYKFSKTKIIVYFSGQNKKDRESDIGYFIYDTKKNKTIKISKKPILTRGRTGSFDDSAVVPSQIIKFKNKFYLYYVGWTQGKKIPYMPSIGLAYSTKLTGRFKKLSLGPIIDKSIYDHYFVSSCFIEKKNQIFQMYYTSCVGWFLKGKSFIPKYLIKKCNSRDGINWVKNNKISINFENKFEKSITRPWIIQVDKKKYMFFSHKNNNYKIGLANYDFEKSNWKRLNKKIFDKKYNGKMNNLDNISNEYAAVIKMKNELYMFYNGNNYGKDGIALATMNYDEFRKSL